MLTEADILKAAEDIQKATANQVTVWTLDDRGYPRWRHVERDWRFTGKNGHHSFCSKGCGPIEECHICTRVRSY